MRRFAVLSTAALLALSVAGENALAQGFGVYEHDACHMARAGTGVAAPCSGGSAIMFNPAGILGGSNRWDVSFGGTLITLDFNYRDSARATSTDAVKNAIPIPNAYVLRQLNDKWAVGFGVYAPYGLIVEWPTTFEGRFLAYRSDLAAIYFQPTVAFQPVRGVRLGGGLTYVHSRVSLAQRIDLSAQTAQPGVTFANLGVPLETDFADAQVEGSSNNMSGHFGIILEPHPRISFGARYLMRMRADIQGDATFSQVSTGIILPAGNPLGVPGGTPLDSVVAPQFRGSGLLTEQHASAIIPLPDQLVLGVAVRPTEALTLLFDYQWVNWSVFNQLPLTFAKLGSRVLNEDYQNTSGYRFGAEYRMNRMMLRGGFLWHDEAAPDQTVTPLLPEAARTEWTAGIGFQLRPRMRVDLAYQNITQADRRGRVVEPTVRGPAGAAVNTGIYTGGANLFGASFVLGF